MKLLTPPQAAETMGTTVGTLAFWRCTGSGPVYCKIGRSVRYPVEEVKAFVDARMRTSTFTPKSKR